MLVDLPDIDEHPTGFPDCWLELFFTNLISTNYRVNALATTYVQLVEAAPDGTRRGQVGRWKEASGYTNCPDGHVNFPHLWPGQTPPPRRQDLRECYSSAPFLARRALASFSR